jgi:hypothetical protein
MAVLPKIEEFDDSSNEEFTMRTILERLYDRF